MNSHIIPEFIYKAMYDSKHKYHVLSTQTDRSRPMEQKGLRESLLCGDCEQKLSVYEKYAREVLFGGSEIMLQNMGEYLILTELNYEKLKLFQLSILWRASISTLSMFSEVNLKSEDEDQIRNFIYAGNPGEQTDYPCLMFGLTSKSGVHDNFIDKPFTLDNDEQITYRFLFAGFMWIFFSSSNKIPSQLKNIVLNEMGKMIIPIKEFDEQIILKDFANELFSMGRLNKPTE
jgi:hypothetical protein